VCLSVCAAALLLPLSLLATPRIFLRKCERVRPINTLLSRRPPLRSLPLLLLLLSECYPTRCCNGLEDQHSLRSGGPRIGSRHCDGKRRPISSNYATRQKGGAWWCVEDSPALSQCLSSSSSRRQRVVVTLVLYSFREACSIRETRCSARREACAPHLPQSTRG
jgi:hypothetical protein